MMLSENKMLIRSGIWPRSNNKIISALLSLLWPLPILFIMMLNARNLSRFAMMEYNLSQSIRHAVLSVSGNDVVVMLSCDDRKGAPS